MSNLNYIFFKIIFCSLGIILIIFNIGKIALPQIWENTIPIGILIKPIQLLIIGLELHWKCPTAKFHVFFSCTSCIFSCTFHVLFIYFFMHFYAFYAFSRISCNFLCILCISDISNTYSILVDEISGFISSGRNSTFYSTGGWDILAQL
jgi:hypothetical protein